MMPRPLRADEAGGIYHALNRGNARQEIFHKVEDYVAFEKVLVEGLKRHPVDLFAYGKSVVKLSPWPIARFPGWVDRVNSALSEAEENKMKRSIHRGSPLGTERWVESIARRLNLESTLRPRRRPKKLA